MTPRFFPLSPTLLSVGLVVLGCAGGGTPSVDLGDGSSGSMLWGAIHYMYEDKDLDKALAYADKAVEIHGPEARRMQASLSDFPVTDPPEATFKYKALNDVGLALWTKGEILMEKGDRAGATEAFSTVLREYGYAQTQDLGEWHDYAPSVPRNARGFMKVADLAKLRLADIEAGRE